MEERRKKQVFNPYLPLGEYIPDGEPHVFGDRVYVFGSHDMEGGTTFCMLDYVTYSAPVEDLTDWRYEGVIYRADQDPQYGTEVPWFNHVEENTAASALSSNTNTLRFMYAPDVVQGPDGRFYLYYAMGGDYGVGGYTCPISVAAADSPAGPYEFLGFVRNPDGTPMKRYICFDPAVLNDNGTIRLYYGTQYDYEERPGFTKDSEYMRQEVGMFNLTPEEILSYPDSIMGPVTVTLQPDMLTIADEPRHIIPYRVKGTSFEEHPFFEASSMRKMGEKYYFVYSSMQNHELCYATSDYPDRDFTFGGTIVSNGDVGYLGRSSEERLNMTGTTHGSITEINGQWYVFYHRLTHKSDYSRQACAEKIEILPDGRIKQVEITSCGLNPGPLEGKGEYPAAICCNLTNGHMPHGSNRIYDFSFPNVNHRVSADGETVERFIDEICDGTLIGYKYFDFRQVSRLRVKAEAETEGSFEVRIDMEGPAVGTIGLHPTGPTVDGNGNSSDGSAEGVWKEFEGEVQIPDGIHALYLIYHGEGLARLLSFEIE